MYASYKFTVIKSVTRNTAIHTLHIISIYPLTNMPIVFHMHASLYCTALLICPSNVTYITNAKYFMSRCDATMLIYMSHMNSLQSPMSPGTLVYTSHYWHMSLTSIPTSLHIYVPLHWYCCLLTDPTLIHTSVKNNMKHLFTIPLPYMGQQQISPSYTMCPNYSTCLNGRSMPKYMPHMNSVESTMWQKHYAKMTLQDSLPSKTIVSTQ